MFALATILSLLTAIAGWYYAFYSPAAERLEGIENPANNRRRVRLRRVNGILMFLMAVCLFLAVAAIDRQWSLLSIITLWPAVFILLFAVGVLGMVDLRMTQHLRHDLKQRDEMR